MPRSGEDARRRLRHAALELFAEHGFDHVTAAQIAERAGVTERTFFRHFPDKREVLFDGQDRLGAALSEAIGKAPPDLAPMQALRWAFSSAVETFEKSRQYAEPRQRVIAATPALQERELTKHVAIARVVAEALQRRGVEKQRSDLAAQTGLAILGGALTAWFADSSLGLGDYLDRGFAELYQLSQPIGVS
ncbi:TetR family transcriptional regulator [Phreatobacter sp. AB_2022a]|uniref:TetR family transcriptional regulator n=1 Tax=Phreatobacter sp. AB_2022a TaxID=3003134 RepID=UPI0022873411|nr:TetR family transcriptional regulator [Phreatobacter sp. AB_2022a]MCZ0737962.1 TetR family transcriptional regulator [Phreatobacter sp. AB_2022a]